MAPPVNMRNGRKLKRSRIRSEKMTKKRNAVRDSFSPTIRAHWTKDAFAEIDWHDYAIVQTIEFTAADANSELPAPMSVQEVENMTLAQKRMAAMVMETTAEDVEAHRARQAAAEAEAAAAVGGVGGTPGDEDAAMEQSDDEAEGARQQEPGVIQRPDTIPPVSETAGNIKIRTDYVPKRASVALVVDRTNRSNSLSWSEKPKTGYDYVLNLWTTSTCQRTPRAHAYRVVGPSLEIPARCTGSKESTSFRAATWS